MTDAARLAATERVDRMLGSLSKYRVEDRIYELAEGVRLGLRASRHGDAIYVLKVKTEARQRGLGRATEALEFLCSTADEHGVELFLEVEPFGTDGLDKAALVAWYARFGFRGEPDEMIREPRRDEGGE